MANPTTYFGWVMPTSTDLVTDLPADFNVFGQGVDTSMQDLLGGTTGQILSKTSATNMDFTWINNDTGDITGVTAGTGISVTSPTGPVPTVAIDTAVTVDKTTAQTLTNKTLTSPALTTPTISTATTNGDILYGTGSGALSRLGIGSSAQVLTVAAGIPSWATPSAGGAFTSLASGAMASSVSLTSISGSYTDLYLVLTNVVTSVNDQGGVRINNDTTGANYLAIGNRNIAGTLTQQDTTSSFVQFTLNSSLMASTTLNSFVIYFPNYAQTAGYKTVKAQGYFNNNLSTFTAIDMVVGYKSASAITRLDLVTAGSSWAVQGTYTLYGVK